MSLIQGYCLGVKKLLELQQRITENWGTVAKALSRIQKGKVSKVSMFVATIVTVTRKGTSLDVPQQMSGLSKCGTWVQWDSV